MASEEALGKIGKKIVEAVPEWFTKFTVGTIAADIAMRKQDHFRMLHQQKEQRDQERRSEKKRARYMREAYTLPTEADLPPNPSIKALEDYSGVPQQLYMQRTGHTNSWGGKKY